MASRTQLHKMIGELNKQGKLIEAGWIGLRLAAIPENAPEIQLEEMRNAFFAGAQHLFTTIMLMLDENAEPTERDLDNLTLIDRELREYIEDYAKRHNLDTTDMPPRRHKQELT